GHAVPLLLRQHGAVDFTVMFHGGSDLLAGRGLPQAQVLVICPRHALPIFLRQHGAVDISVMFHGGSPLLAGRGGPHAQGVVRGTRQGAPPAPLLPRAPRISAFFFVRGRTLCPARAPPPPRGLFGLCPRRAS